jgi:hypothetical protein
VGRAATSLGELERALQAHVVATAAIRR